MARKTDGDVGGQRKRLEDKIQKGKERHGMRIDSVQKWLESVGKRWVNDEIDDLSRRKWVYSPYIFH